MQNNILTKQTRIAVLRGGFSSEFEVSQKTAARVIEALRTAGYTAVTPIEVDRDVAALLKEQRPEVVFNALHGAYGEDGRIQGLLDIMAIPYTGSAVAASAIAMNKVFAKMAMHKLGIPNAPDALIEVAPGKPIPFEPSFVLKEVEGGSSIGVSIVLDEQEWRQAMRTLPLGRQLLVEERIIGRELTVAVIGDTVLGDLEIIPFGRSYDFTAKYEDPRTRFVPTPALDPFIRTDLHRYAYKLHHALGCRGVTRTDFMLGTDNRLYCLEINTLPGLTDHSLVPKIAYDCRGITYIKLLELLLEEALSGKPLKLELPPVPIAEETNDAEQKARPHCLSGSQWNIAFLYHNSTPLSEELLDLEKTLLSPTPLIDLEWRLVEEKWVACRPENDVFRLYVEARLLEEGYTKEGRRDIAKALALYEKAHRIAAKEVEEGPTDGEREVMSFYVNLWYLEMHLNLRLALIYFYYLKKPALAAPYLDGADAAATYHFKGRYDCYIKEMYKHCEAFLKEEDKG